MSDSLGAVSNAGVNVFKMSDMITSSLSTEMELKQVNNSCYAIWKGYCYFTCTVEMFSFQSMLRV